MAYGTPTDPVAGTVITVAYAVANILDPIRWLRLLQGNADPPGSAYVVVSDSTTGTTWRKIPTDAIADGAVTSVKLAAGAAGTSQLADGSVTDVKIVDGNVSTQKIVNLAVTTTKLADLAVTAAKLAAGVVVAHLGYTPANKAGETFTGDVRLNPGILLQLARADGFMRTLLAVISDEAVAGNVNIPLRLLGSAITHNGDTVWTSGNDGPTSGLAAQTAASATTAGSATTAASATDSSQLGGVAAANYARLNATGVFSAAQKLANNIFLILQETPAFDRTAFGMSPSNEINVGNAANALRLLGSAITHNGDTVWTSGNDGPTSGLAAQTAASATTAGSATTATTATNATQLGGVAAAGYPTLASGGDFATAPTINSKAIARVASGSYSGDNAFNRQIAVGFICRYVLITAINGAASVYWHVISATPGQNIKTSGTTTASVSQSTTTALDASDGFRVDNGSDVSNASGVTYHYVAFG